jgi:hypothetical protein
VILRGLPKISGRGGDGALEGPGPWEAISPSGRGSGAAPSVGFVLSMSTWVAGVAEDAPGAVVVLVTSGVASATSAVSDRPPMLGGSIASGAGTALFVGGASVDARPPSSSTAHGGAVRMVVAAGSGPGVV